MPGNRRWAQNVHLSGRAGIQDVGLWGFQSGWHLRDMLWRGELQRWEPKNTGTVPPWDTCWMWSKSSRNSRGGSTWEAEELSRKNSRCWVLRRQRLETSSLQNQHVRSVCLQHSLKEVNPSLSLSRVLHTMSNIQPEIEKYAKKGPSDRNQEEKQPYNTHKPTGS